MHRYTQGTEAQPAVGVDLANVPNYGDSFRLLSLRVTLTTSAVVANRYPHFQYVTPSGAVLFETVPSTAQVASKSTVYQLTAGNGAPNEGSAVNDNVSGIAAPDFWLPAGTKIRTVTTAIDVGDQWSAVYYSMLVGEEQEHLHLLSEIVRSLGG